MDELQAELTNDPEGLGYAGKTAAEIGSLINDKRFPFVGQVTMKDFGAILYESGAFDAIFDAAESGNAAAAREVRRLQLACQLGLDVRMGIQRNIDKFLAIGIPQGVVDALVAKATVMQSRAEQLGLGFIHDSQIREAM